MEQAYNDIVADDSNINLQYTSKDSCTADNSLNNNAKKTYEDDHSTTKWNVIRRRAAAITAAVIICEFCIFT